MRKTSACYMLLLLCGSASPIHYTAFETFGHKAQMWVRDVISPNKTEFSETKYKISSFFATKIWSFGKVLQILWIDVKGNLLLPAMRVQLLVHRDDVEVNIQGKEMLIETCEKKKMRDWLRNRLLIKNPQFWNQSVWYSVKAINLMKNVFWI